MILIDTNVLVAMIDPADALRDRAVRAHKTLPDTSLFLAPAVLTEAVYMLPHPILRAKLQQWMHWHSVKITGILENDSRYDDVFEWMAKYSDHQPDWTDACLAVLSGLDRRFRIWTYDLEFRTTWRRPDGSRIPLAV